MHGVTDDPEQPGPAARRRARLLPATAWSTSTSSSAAASAGWWWRWRAAGVRRGFGIDENTALLVEGARRAGLRRVRRHARRHGPASVDPAGAASATSASATSTTATASTSPASARAGRRQAPGAQARDRLPRAGPLAAQRLRRLHALRPDGPPRARRPGGLHRRPGRGLRRPLRHQRHRRARAPAAPLARADRHARERPPDVGAELPLLDQERAAERHPPRRPPRQPRPHLRHDAEPRGADRAARLLAARAPTRRCSAAPLALVGAGPVGVFAAASAEPDAHRRRARRAPRRATACTAVDLGVTIDNRRLRRSRTHELLEEHRRPARHPALRRQPESAWSRRCCTAARRAPCSAPSPAPTPRARR